MFSDGIDVYQQKSYAKVSQGKHITRMGKKVCTPKQDSKDKLSVRDISNFIHMHFVSLAH